MKKLALLALVTIATLTKAQNPKVVISTTLGEIIVEVYLDKAPITASNFLIYIDKGKYNKHAFFYRVVKQSNSSSGMELIQGGYCEDSIIERLQLPPIKHEKTKDTGIKHRNGTISMARLEPGTASSEFFICIGSQPGLDYKSDTSSDEQGYAAFGKVIEGMNIVRKIQRQKDKDQYLTKPVKLLSAKRLYEKP